MNKNVVRVISFVTAGIMVISTLLISVVSLFIH